MEGLHRARTAKGLTLAAAAKQLGFTAAVLRALEEGVFPPNPEELRALERVFGHIGAQQLELETGQVWGSDG